MKPFSVAEIQMVNTLLGNASVPAPSLTNCKITSGLENGQGWCQAVSMIICHYGEAPRMGDLKYSWIQQRVY